MIPYGICWLTINYQGEKGKYSASLDRISPELGYTEGNVMVMSSLANTMKSNASEKELKAFSSWIEVNF